MNDEIISNETRLTRIQALVVDILSNLLRAPIDQTDHVVNEAITRLGEYCVRDRAYVFVHEGDATNNTHEWCANGIEPMIEHLQGLPIELYGPIAEALDLGEPFHVPDVQKLPEGSPSREVLESQEIRSILLVPMRSEGKTYGFVGFDGVHNTHAFLPGEVYLLQSLADVICSVLTRREKDQAVRAAQAELAGERAFLASILATSAMGIIVIDAAGIIQFCNDSAESIMGASREQMIGRRHDSRGWAYTREDGTPFQPGETPYDHTVRTGEPSPPERFALHCPEGLRYCSVHAAPVRGDATAARVVYALVDVTEQVAGERARQEALEEAHRANAAKSNFLAKMSHEMRTPLNGVLGVAEVLDSLIVDEDQRRMVHVMHESGELLLSIINDLLDMSKIEADLLEIEMTPFVPADLAKRIESVHTLKATEKHIGFDVVVKGEDKSMRLGDPNRILQIMHNVISNAIKFTEEGSVEVEMDCTEPDAITLLVRDTGIGMTDEQKTQVFEEFGQADSSIARRFGGTGLGMPIVRRLVEMMDGTISLESVPDEGTAVMITLPLRRTDTPEPRAPRTSASGGPSADLQGMRVLAADDNHTNRMILGAMMGQLGISSVLVQDGTEALDAYGREGFDLIILDISMPNLDGVSVLREIRAREAKRAEELGPKAPETPLPIVAFTANAMSHQVEGYLAAGFDDCLTKPLQLDRLRSALNTLVEERGRRHTQPDGRSNAAE
ncbi:GAF domain-containing hybrid sensor histidine kinase/response regulator [Pararhodobacter zhoushanensis]|uniref:GAF domain-containing hybrid sensor histidine kinase/response regulator n=1 Tax=Pararhodobacter zhoushanensis TaxID=2479545 RepID=UPI000F8F5C6A|nr:ATP-binding protein [Pararhodobacter zhoushanensis]